ncbi:hypothetical protein C5167_018019 [Papaver somniferum]|uniref:Uncharacterized protein n=1 Tax=Papaver somniferum TaxID=3469 RepID=A0A4Y7IL28_PAPSO|nr:hypothetical protein C5167_018019 [Papaver somniferum]
MVEYARRVDGLESSYPKWKIPYNKEEYTVENFFLNYDVVIVKNNQFRWGVRLVRSDGIADNKRIMRDIGFHNPSNESARHSKDVHLVEGADGSNLPLPEKFAAYNPWDFKWPKKNDVMMKKDKKNVSKAPNSHDDELFPAESGGVPLKVKGNGKVVISKYTTKNPSKKRKLFSPSPLNTSSYDDALPLPDNSASVSSMVDLSSIFSDTISGVDNDALGHECDFVVKICDAPSLRHDSLRGVASALTPITNDMHRKIQALGAKNTKLINEHSSSSSRVVELRRRNDHLVEIYNLTDEAISHPVDDEILLEHLNASLNNISNDGLENISLDEFRSKYKILNREHRTMLSVNNGFKRRLHENKEETKRIEAKKNALITEKDQVFLKGRSSRRKNEILSRLLIENDDEFEWDAKFINRARDDLATNVSLKLKKKLVVNVSKMNKDALLLRDIHVKKYAEEICADHNIPLPDFNFVDVPVNEESSEISDGEAEYEEYEVTGEENSDSEAKSVVIGDMTMKAMISAKLSTFSSWVVALVPDLVVLVVPSKILVKTGKVHLAGTPASCICLVNGVFPAYSIASSNCRFPPSLRAIIIALTFVNSLKIVSAMVLSLSCCIGLFNHACLTVLS